MWKGYVNWVRFVFTRIVPNRMLLMDQIVYVVVDGGAEEDLSDAGSRGAARTEGRDVVDALPLLVHILSTPHCIQVITKRISPIGYILFFMFFLQEGSVDIIKVVFECEFVFEYYFFIM